MTVRMCGSQENREKFYQENLLENPPVNSPNVSIFLLMDVDSNGHRLLAFSDLASVDDYVKTHWEEIKGSRDRFDPGYCHIEWDADSSVGSLIVDDSTFGEEAHPDWEIWMIPLIASKIPEGRPKLLEDD